MRVQAFDENGLEAQEQFLAREREQRVELVPEVASEGLELVVRAGAGGAPLTGARVQVFYGGARGASFRTSEGGRVVVPRAEDIRLLVVGAAGHAPVTLRASGATPHQVPGPPLEVFLDPLTHLEVHVLDEGGVPISGFQVSVSNLDPRDALPGRLGADPPGWELAPPGASSVLTGADGGAAFVVAMGSYAVDVRPPALLGHEGLGVALYRTQRKKIYVAADTEMTFHVSRMRRVSVEVFEASSGLPVSELLLVSQDGSATLPRRGNLWQGVLSSEDRRLQVVSPGVGAMWIDLPRGSEPFHARIDLQPDDPALVRIEGLEDDHGADLVAHLMVRLPDGGFTELTQVRLRPRGDGSCELSVPTRDEVFLSIGRVRVRGRSWHFEPEIVAWKAGATLSFRAVEDP
ncbi:MAG TPA: hypothetical protein ENJ09_03870 [Planctomycetes bacterium]|nr:hypothetical protein [Planctomycetota bacterium]